MKSVMTQDFSKIQANKVQRSVFNRSHGHKTTFSAGDLIPFFVDEILPGDTMGLKAQIFARLSTFTFPIMDNLFLDTFYFFVPDRLLWDNWERFQGAQDDPGDTIDYEVPEVSVTGDPPQFASGDLADHFGLPVGVSISTEDRPMALPFRAYNLIWNEWFRDQDLQESVPVQTGDGPDVYSDNYSILKRGKRHDYFTACRPWPQKGDSVSIPLGTTAPIIGDGQAINFYNGTSHFSLNYNNNTGFNGMLGVTSEGGAIGGVPTGTFPSNDIYLGINPSSASNSHMLADLSSATAATINQLRESFAIQQILEMDARGGTRYVESLRARWGVISPDFRLQRPEYLGGSSQSIDVRGVAKTSSTDATSPQANLASYTQVSSRSGFNRSFVEHGIIIGLVNVRADITYQEGMRRMWSRRTRYDFYMPELAHLGEQAVLNKEIWYPSGNTAVANGVFGYQERWAEYRYLPSLVTGLFKSAAAGTLDGWHLALDFTAVPVLNSSFIVDAPPIDRVLAVVTEPHVLMDSYIEIRHARPMPVYSVPGLNRL